MVAPFAMVAGGTISATQIYKPQNIIAWGKFGAIIIAFRYLFKPRLLQFS